MHGSSVRPLMQYDQRIVMHKMRSFSTLKYGQFFVDQRAGVADLVTDSLPLQFKPVDDRLRHMTGVVG